MRKVEPWAVKVRAVKERTPDMLVWTLMAVQNRPTLTKMTLRMRSHQTSLITDLNVGNQIA
jgi:hypothetical protein